MKKLLLVFVSCTFLTTIMAQENKFWSVYKGNGKISTDKSIARQSFPKEFKLFGLNSIALQQELFSIVGNQSSNHSTVISLPNADGQIEDFEVFEEAYYEFTDEENKEAHSEGWGIFYTGEQSIHHNLFELQFGQLII